MKALLRSFNLSDNAIKIYLDGLGKNPYTFSEIQRILLDLSEKQVKLIVDELIEKKLILAINPKNLDPLSHYISIPPYAAMLNSITELIELPDGNKIEKSKNNPILERFQDALYQDLEKISGDLIELLSKQSNSNQTMNILSEVEENVKQFARVILNDVIGLISPLRMQSAVDARDFSKLIESITQKITESEDIATNMFSQFNEIVNDMGSPETPAQVEAFKTFIRKLGELIDKRIQDLAIGTGSIPLEKIKLLENSLYEILTNFISSNTDGLDHFWQVNSSERVKEITSVLLDRCTNELTIIVPNIEQFIPLEKFELEFSQDLSVAQEIKINVPKKSIKSEQLITKKQKKEIEEKLELTSKKVAELKGFELSHDIADVVALISEVNPESMVIENIKGWLNRLLAIRKHLDSNTQYLLLESIDKWKKEYSKVKKKEKKPENELIQELKSKISNGKSQEIDATALSINIFSSESHENKNAFALAKKENIEYLQLNNNNTFAIIGDNSYFIFGVYQKTSNKPTFEITGFYTTCRPLIETLKPLIDEIKVKAKYPKDIEINRGFNEIVENINDYTGKKIGKKLKNLLDVVFEKDGISLDILELKLLIGKLGKLYQPLDNEMKEHVINELNNLNKKFSTLDLIYPPDLRAPILEEETKVYLEMGVAPPEFEPLDPEKIDNLFELLLEKIDDLKGVEISKQIDKFIEIILKLQGYSNIIEWKKSLGTVDEVLEEPFKEKIKEDLLKWKLGILQQSSPTNIQHQEQSTETHGYSIQETASSILEEEYLSPGLAQSQFGTEEESSSEDEPANTDPDFSPSFEIIEESDEIGELGNRGDLVGKFNSLIKNAQTFKGNELSNSLQSVADILLQSHGAVAVNVIRQWISKLRSIKEPLEEEIKDELLTELENWKEKFS